jgi:hypothetical protein
MQKNDLVIIDVCDAEGDAIMTFKAPSPPRVGEYIYYGYKRGTVITVAWAIDLKDNDEFDELEKVCVTVVDIQDV